MAAAVLGQAVLKVGANTKGFSQGLQGMGKGLTSIMGQVQQFAGALGTAGKVALGFSAALVAALAPAIILGSRFEKQMSAVKSVMGDLAPGVEGAAKSFEELNDVVKELGASTQFTATEVGKAAEFLGLAGFSAQEAMEGLPATLALAAAGTLELGRASDIASDTMTAFGLQATDLTRVVDVLAQTAANSNTTVELLGSAMSFVAPIAATLGQNIEEVSAALGVLANAGIKGSAAGTGLAQSFTQLAKKGDKLNGILSDYGLTFEDVNPEVVSLSDIIKKFAAAGLSAGDAMTIFGARAGRTILALTKQGGPALDELREKLEAAAGAAERMQNIRLDNTVGDFTKLKSAIEGLAIEVFESMKESLRGVIAFVTKIVVRIREWVKQNKSLVGAITSAMGALAGILAVLGTVAVAFSAVIAAVAGLVAIGAKVILIGIAIAAVMAAQAAVLLAVLAPVILAIKENWDKLKTAWKAAWENVIKPVWDAFVKAVKAGWEKFVKPAFEKLKAAVGRVIDAFKDFMVSIGELRPMLEGIAGTIGTLVVGAIGLMIDATTLAIDAFGALAGAAADVTSAVGGALQDAGQALGLFDSDEEVAARLAKEAEAMKRAGVAARALSGEMKALREQSRTGQADMKKRLDLQERLGSLTEIELKDLDKLRKAGKGGLAENKNRIASLEKQIKASEKLLASGLNLSDADEAQLRGLVKLNKEDLEREKLLGKRAEITEKLAKGGLAALDAEIAKTNESIEADKRKQLQLIDSIELGNAQLEDTSAQSRELEELTKEIEAQEKALGILNSQDRQRIKNLGELNGDVGALAEKMKQLRLTVKAGKQATDDLASSESKFLDLLKELNDKGLKGLEKELDAVKELRKAREALLKQREADLKIEQQGLEAQLDQIKSLEESESKTNKLRRANEDLADSREELKQIGDALHKVRQREVEDLKKLRDAARQNRRDIIRDLQIKEAQAQDDPITARRLQAQKEREDFQKLLDEKFQLDGVNNARIMEQRRQAEFLFNKEQSRKLAEAFKQADEKKQVVKVAEAEANIEKTITQQLGSQVKTIREMFQLYNAIAHIRRVQEDQALQAGQKVLDAEFKIAKLKERRADEFGKGGKGVARLDQLIAREQKRLDILQAIEVKRANEAQLGDVGANAEVVVQEQIKQKLQANVQEIANIRLKFLDMLDEIKIAFGAAPKSWVDAFVAAWVAEGQRMVAAVAATMADIKIAMDPDTEASPSLNQIWDMNVASVTKGVEKLNQALQTNNPNMSALKQSQLSAVQQTGIGMGGVGPQPIAKALNDNRKVDMVIHNNVDMDDMKRQVGRALENVNMNTGSEI